ncbi:MAG: hypothetical protein L0H94_14480 [Nitrospira sp.]|nr:hypothetical protein [Nitrospira sp.]
MAKKTKPAAKNQTAPYKHPEAKSLMRPEVGTQAQFKKKKPPKTYRYDSSLSPALDWDAKNLARDQGETLIKQVLDAKSLEEAKAAASKLKSLSKPFLNWPARQSGFRSMCRPYRSLSMSGFPRKPLSKRWPGIRPTSRRTCSPCSAIRSIP